MDLNDVNPLDAAAIFVLNIFSVEMNFNKVARIESSHASHTYLIIYVFVDIKSI